MSAEKMAILKMLEDGKITAENAANLLAAIDGGERAAKTEERDIRQGSQGAAYPHGTKSRADSDKWSSISKKLETAAKDLEPKLQKLAGAVVEKSVELADAASKGIQNARAANAEKERAKASAARESPPEPKAGYAPGAYSASKTYELPVFSDSPNELILRVPQGNIVVKGYNGDKATLHLAGRTSFSESPFLKLGFVYSLDLVSSPSDGKRDVEIFIPSRLFSKVFIETDNGSVELGNFDADNVTVNASSCGVSVKNVKAGVMKIDTLNGGVIISGCSGKELIVENANGAIETVNADFKSIKAETTSEPVTIVSQGFYAHSDYRWVVRTSNAKLKASLPVAMDLGYDICAYTSLSDVSNGLSGIRYTRNDRNRIEGKSENYMTCAKKVRLEFDTSNAPLTIN